MIVSAGRGERDTQHHGQVIISHNIVPDSVSPCFLMVMWVTHTMGRSSLSIPPPSEYCSPAHFHHVCMHVRMHPCPCPLMCLAHVAIAQPICSQLSSQGILRSYPISILRPGPQDAIFPFSPGVLLPFGILPTAACVPPAFGRLSMVSLTLRALMITVFAVRPFCHTCSSVQFPVSVRSGTI